VEKVDGARGEVKQSLAAFDRKFSFDINIGRAVSRSLSKYYLRIQSVPQRKQHFTITNINWLILFREIITVYSENHTKHIIKNNSELVTVEAGGTLGFRRLTLSCPGFVYKMLCA
jgi:hypothetical protein